ncbi:MAG: hypothetical protein SF187_05050 [Deltaproteobacteria bacterium]|nr:hypothetical protein [Deltaproteobacteria bacterium]
MKYWLFLLAVLWACGPEESRTGGVGVWGGMGSADGGSTAVAGRGGGGGGGAPVANGSGGEFAAGGTAGASTGTGGVSSASGGASAGMMGTTGGKGGGGSAGVSTGGAGGSKPATGGNSGTGGTQATGGSPATGGTQGTGGAPATGGASGTGGNTGKPNLVMNAGFESGENMWKRLSGTGALASPGHTGNNRIDEPSPNHWWQQDLSGWLAGRTYRISAWGKVTSGECTVGLKIALNTGGDQRMSSPTFTSTWSEKSIVMTVPNTAVWLQVFFSGGGTNCSFDDVQVIEQ